ncbi:MAG: hypothetical protein M1821_003329 [Bathelium mastoideum]|nr:MAG: hypothetical protein M1821_003329 [Bathelium mastoideum]
MSYKIDILRNEIAKENLERLALIEPLNLPDIWKDTVKNCSIGPELLKIWNTDNNAVDKNAIDAQVFGNKGPDINYNNAFLAFMESTAVYLRDWGKLVKAWTDYRELKKLGGEDSPGKFKTAISNYNDPTSQIRELAKTWAWVSSTL